MDDLDQPARVIIAADPVLQNRLDVLTSIFDRKAEYAAMIEAGKPTRSAIAALMRKLVVLAKVLLRNDRKGVKTVA